MKKLSKILSALLVLILSVFTLSGCSDKEKPTATVKDFLETFKSKNYEKVYSFVNDSESIKDKLNASNAEMPDKVSKVILDKIADVKYEVTEEKIEKNKASVKVKLEVNDIGHALTETITEYMQTALTMAFDENADEKAMEKLAEEKMLDKLNGKLDKVTKDVEIKLEKKNDKWVIEPSDDLINALTGNMKALAEAFEE
ncbi:lumazine-binding domain-containing protein [Gottschalkia purinilytica]|uniref:Lumazine-binding domain-containing protein n=1 Tax=Gottschalkia purinilytica TaxID=1503 RepID=A0A0L0WF65_GOTPU|nr:DUF4878 domain-containing protein [Gottschalkia purinilytica]KNF10071.1 lumazine-binding domain-containing protein [Gottschalkia purinilytica]